MPSTGRNAVRPIRIVLAAVLVSVFVAPAALASSFFIIGDGSTESSITPLLTARGHTVTLFSGVYDYNFTGATSLTPYDAVILLDGEGASGMPTSGQNALTSFVSGGKGIVITEWVALEYRMGGYASMGDLIPLRRAPLSGGFETTDTYYVQGVHEITNGLPANFGVPKMGSNAGTAVSGSTVLVTGTKAGDAVVIDTYGTGRIVQFASAGNYGGYMPFNQGSASANFNLLFVQGAEWAAGAGGPAVPEPVTMAGLVLGLGGLATYVRRRRAA